MASICLGLNVLTEPLLSYSLLHICITNHPELSTIIITFKYAFIDIKYVYNSYPGEERYHMSVNTESAHPL